MELNAEDIAVYMSEGEAVKEAILLMEDILTSTNDHSSQLFRQNDPGAIKIKSHHDQRKATEGGEGEDDSGDAAAAPVEAYPEGLTVRAKLKGNLLALWDFDASSMLTGRHQPPPPQFLFVLERVVAQLAEPTPTLPYAFSLTFTNDEQQHRGDTTAMKVVEQRFRFSAFSEQDRTEWVQAIAACSHELLGVRIRAIADGVKELGLGGGDQEVVEKDGGSNSGGGSPFYQFVKKPTLTRAPPLSRDPTAVAATSSSSSSASWSSNSIMATATSNSDMSPLEPDGDPDAFAALYANCITKKLSLETGRGVLRVREDMAEPKVTLLVPSAILEICIRCSERSIGHMHEIGYLPPTWDAVRLLHMKRLQQFADRLDAARKHLSNYDGPPFKASRTKTDANVAPIPTNLHLQRFSIWDSTRAVWTSHDFFTSGCFAAISEGFGDGGARRIRQKLRQISTTTSTAGLNDTNGTTGVSVVGAIDYDFAKLTFWQNELVDVGNRLDQLKLRLHKWSPKNVDELRSVGKVAAEVRTLSEQLRQLCDSIPRIPNAITELATFYHQYEASRRVPTTAPGGGEDGQRKMKSSTDSNEFSVETLESQREDFEAELACLITKVENLSQVDEAAFENAGSDRDAWVSSFCAAANGVITRIEKLRRSILHGLYYGMLRALSTAESSALHYDLLYRQVIIVSQALTSITAALLHELWMSDGERLQHSTSSWTRCGSLLVVHSYMSCYQNEYGMIEDMCEVMRLLREHCAFRVAKSFAGVKNCASPIVEGDYGHFRITLPVPNRAWSYLPESLRRGEWFYSVPVYWNVGINHEQTLASKLGGTALESEVNEIAYKTLRGYVKRLANCDDETQRSLCEKSRTLLDRLCSMLCTNESKNVQLLSLSTQLCQLLNGSLFICCKSGKDRTSMGVTLEETSVLHRQYGMPESHVQITLDTIRRDGTRLENTSKNIGQRQYAFGSLQLHFLPDSYRPPKGTFRKMQT